MLSTYVYKTARSQVALTSSVAHLSSEGMIDH